MREHCSLLTPSRFEGEGESQGREGRDWGIEEHRDKLRDHLVQGERGRGGEIHNQRECPILGIEPINRLVDF